MKVPGYTWIEGVGSLQNDPVLDVVQGLIIHCTGTLESPLNYFDGPSGGIESHLYCPRSKDDRREQYRDTNREADANFKANSWVGEDHKRHGYISFELMGLGSGIYTAWQMSEIKRVALVLSQEHGFALKEPAGPKSYGVGYHTMFPEWSNVPGKICPGPKRIQQYHTEIVPWMEQQRAADKEFYTTKEGDAIWDVAKKFDTTVAQLWRLNPDVNLPLKANTKVRVRKAK